MTLRDAFVVIRGNTRVVVELSSIGAIGFCNRDGYKTIVENIPLDNVPYKVVEPYQDDEVIGMYAKDDTLHIIVSVDTVEGE